MAVIIILTIFKVRKITARILCKGQRHSNVCFCRTNSRRYQQFKRLEGCARVPQYRNTDFVRSECHCCHLLLLVCLCENRFKHFTEEPVVPLTDSRNSAEPDSADTDQLRPVNSAAARRWLTHATRICQRWRHDNTWSRHTNSMHIQHIWVIHRSAFR